MTGEPVRVQFPYFDAFGEIIIDVNFYQENEARLAAHGYFSSAHVVASSPHKDLAVLQLDTVPSGKHAVRLATEATNAGEVLHIVGHPAERPNWSYSVGIVDVVEESVHLDWWAGFEAKSVWFFGSVWYGNSGGPVVNQDGELVGIVSSKTDIEHLAIHVDEVSLVLDELDGKDRTASGK